MKKEQYFEGRKFRLDLIVGDNLQDEETRAIINHYLKTVTVEDFKEDIKYLMTKCFDNCQSYH